MDKAPTLVDNQNDNTLARALVETLTTNGLRQEDPSSSSRELRIATAFFSPAGFKYIADHHKAYFRCASSAWS